MHEIAYGLYYRICIQSIAIKLHCNVTYRNSEKQTQNHIARKVEKIQLTMFLEEQCDA